MPKKKEKLINKIVKKNYNNELELVLENKNFEEKAKNILLSTLYKIETAYKDYEQVKNDVIPKAEFIELIINIIKNDIDIIEIVKINSEEAKILKGETYFIDKEEKKIICYPIERVVLYAILEISKQNKIIKEKYHIISKTITDLINIGNNINSVETIRDFNGFSWDIVTKDIENFEYNLIYQNIRILIGEDFLNKWIYNHEIVLDYFDMFKTILDEKYGNKNKNKFIDYISKLSVLLELMYNETYAKTLITSKIEIQKKLNSINDKENFIKELTKEKKELNKQIKTIDKTINDKDLLQAEYIKRNEKLPLDKKIFSMKVLTKILKEERKKIEQKREKINQILNPQQFVKYVKELEEKYEYLKYVETENIKGEIQTQIIKLQRNFLELYRLEIQNTTIKEQIEKKIIEFRYYLNIYFEQDKKISQIKNIKNAVEKTKIMLIDKAIETKTLTKISNNQDLNYLIINEIFNSKIINLKNINIKLSKEKEKIILSIFDENVFDKKIELGNVDKINIKDFTIKFNKNIKIFI